MKITVFGCGYVGLTTAVGLAEMGNEVLGIDVAPDKIELLEQGIVPFYEPGLQEMLLRQITEGRLRFSTDAAEGIQTSQIIFSAVGTPPLKDHYADLSAVLNVAEQFKKYAKGQKIFINKSTVPIGTSDKILEIIRSNRRNSHDFHVVSNPEFLREGTALKDFFEPDRIVIGVYDHSPEIQKLMKKLYRPMLEKGVPLLFTDIRSAEVIKYASNAYLATRLSFINELANFCETAGADIQNVRLGVGMDKRIGTHFFQPGIGFGGSCLPKDLNALIEMGKQQGFPFRVMEAAQHVNLRQPKRLVQALERIFPTYKGKTIAVWGASFKPGTDDLRDAPSLVILQTLLEGGAKIQIYDPVSLQKLQKIFGKKITYCQDYYRALHQASALLILTEWDEFRNPDFGRMKSSMKEHYILDGRNIFDREEVEKQGFYYYGIGNLSPQRKLKSRRSQVRLGL
ncbi:MAG: UDP-glucose/GDP-mannose dehydrogenase family protein [Candidatus Gracilibacteria bacterium]